MSGNSHQSCHFPQKLTSTAVFSQLIRVHTEPSDWFELEIQVADGEAEMTGIKKRTACHR